MHYAFYQWIENIKKQINHVSIIYMVLLTVLSSIPLQA